jgi:Tol biopolymer transport system component
MTLRSRLTGATILGISMLILAGAHTWAAKGGKGGGKPPPAPADPAIAYVIWSRKGPSSLMVMNADGSNQTEIYQSPDHYFGPVSWSSDGRHIAFEEDLEIFRIDVEVPNGVPTGSNRQLLVGGHDPHVGCPRWSPLGDRILYCTLELGGNAIMAVPAAGGTPETLYTGLNIQLPTWAPDGQRIAFVERTTIKILDLTTGTVSTVRELPGADFDSLDWARTQDVLAYCLGGDDKIYTIDIGTGEITEIGEGHHVSWSPDDSFLAFSGIKTYEFATGDIQKLSRGGRNPDWLR